MHRYEQIVENNEKIAKELLEYAAEVYQNKLHFTDVLTAVEGRKNKKNLILVFLESASSIDSLAFGGKYDRYPLIDKISQL